MDEHLFSLGISTSMRTAAPFLSINKKNESLQNNNKFLLIQIDEQSWVSFIGVNLIKALANWQALFSILFVFDNISKNKLKVIVLVIL